MRSTLVGLFLALILLGACSEEKSGRFLKKSERYQPFIFNMQHYFSESELSVSFPIWFDDSLIKQYRIQKITRSIFIGEYSEENEATAPKEIKTYVFNKNGQLLSLQIEQFYENVKVADNIFDYLSPKDEHGFSNVQVRREKKSLVDEFSLDHFRLYEKQDYTDKFLVYNNEESGDYLFYLLNKKHWGVVAVDSILSPTPRDIITLGTTVFPKKTYQVENTVNELNVVKYQYDKSSKHIKTIEYNEYPFLRKRSILYDQKGGCHGYIDSTFTDDVFLKRRVSKFISEDGMPVQLNHGVQPKDSLSGVFQYEKFDYEFFESKKK